jgi:ureidoglycolate dehydrogenase (NAD+)
MQMVDDSRPASELRVDHQALQAWVVDVLEAVGVDRTDGELVADSLVAADARGVSTHGVTRLPIYVQRMREGLIKVRPRITVDRLGPSSAIVDADDGPGQIATTRAIDEAVELARSTGAAVVTVRNSNHFGAAAYYTRRAAAAGMVGIALSHAEADVVPYGGRTAVLGTNPLSIAVPGADDASPIVLDMATSGVAMGKVLLARQEGGPIPGHWAVDAQGRPTTDPHAARAVVPAAGPKGYGLAVIIDLLSSLLTGAGAGPDVRRMYDDFTAPQGLGHLVAAIDVTRFVPLATFRAGVHAYVARLTAVPPVEGVDRVRAPGEIEADAQRRNRRDGVPLPPAVASALRELGERMGRPVPW